MIVFLGVLDIFKQLGDCLHDGHMEMAYLLGGYLAFQECWALWRRALSPRCH